MTALLLACLPGQAATVYNESVAGDLSNTGLAPTILAITPGSNQVSGTTGRGTAVDRDYFTLTVPVGFQIGAIVELAGTQAGGVSFFGIQAGPQVTLPVTATTADGLLGWVHYASTDAALNLLPALQLPYTGSSGFTALNAGPYAFWVQDFTPGSFTYGFDIQVTPASASPTPEPATFIPAGVGILLLGLTVFRRRSRQ